MENNKPTPKSTSLSTFFLVLMIIIFVAFISKMLIPQIRETGKDKNIIMEREINVSSTGSNFDYSRVDTDTQMFSDLDIILDRINTQIEIVKNKKTQPKSTDMSLSDLYATKSLLKKLKQDTIYSDSVNWQYEMSTARILASMLNYIQSSFADENIPFGTTPKYNLIIDRKQIKGAGKYDSFNFEYIVEEDKDKNITRIVAERKPAETKYYFMLDIPTNEKKCFVYDDKYVEFCKYIL